MSLPFVACLPAEGAGKSALSKFPPSLCLKSISSVGCQRVGSNQTSSNLCPLTSAFLSSALQALATISHRTTFYRHNKSREHGYHCTRRHDPSAHCLRSSIVLNQYLYYPSASSDTLAQWQTHTTTRRIGSRMPLDRKPAKKNLSCSLLLLDPLRNQILTTVSPNRAPRRAPFLTAKFPSCETYLQDRYHHQTSTCGMC